jgi:hypothetical protein
MQGGYQSAAAGIGDADVFSRWALPCACLSGREKNNPVGQYTGKPLAVGAVIEVPAQKENVSLRQATPGLLVAPDKYRVFCCNLFGGEARKPPGHADQPHGQNTAGGLGYRGHTLREYPSADIAKTHEPYPWLPKPGG